LQKVANSILYFKLRRHGQKIRTQQQKNQFLSKNVEKKERKNSFRKQQDFWSSSRFTTVKFKTQSKKEFF